MYLCMYSFISIALKIFRMVALASCIGALLRMFSLFLDHADVHIILVASNTMHIHVYVCVRVHLCTRHVIMIMHFAAYVCVLVLLFERKYMQ
jgi:hypothetical protein